MEISGTEELKKKRFNVIFDLIIKIIFSQLRIIKIKE